MKNIVVIGAGQLGTRHLQALALLEARVNLFVVDPSDDQKKLASERLKQINQNKHEVKYFNTLDELTVQNLDLVIVATNANIRFTIVQNLLEKFSVKYLILEKFLFQRLSEYEEIEKRLDETGTSCYVNCPRRMFASYKKVKSVLKQNESVQMEVVGNNWGLGCNGIHFIDLFQWLTGEPVNNWVNLLSEGFIKSKRSGFIDFSGRLSGSTINHNNLILTSFESHATNVSVRISTPSSRFVIAESLKKMWHEEIDKTISLKEHEFIPLYQSQLTRLVAKELFESGTCELTSYHESKQAHLPFLETLLDHYNMYNSEKSDICPIT
ncbi:MAG: Gfo/Idh/MocA family oxidoreductase [Candidatus Cyclobacteriaceae bacterium M2_1C_046]